MGFDARPAQRSEVWNACATELSLARRVPAVGIVHRTEPQIQHTQFRTSSILYRFANKIRRTKLELVRRRCSHWCSGNQMKTVVLAGGLGTWLTEETPLAQSRWSRSAGGRCCGTFSRSIRNAKSATHHLMQIREDAMEDMVKSSQMRCLFEPSLPIQRFLTFFSDEALVRLIGKTTARQIFASC